MSDWWSNDPVASAPKAGGNWWSNDPLGGRQQAVEPQQNVNDAPPFVKDAPSARATGVGEDVLKSGSSGLARGVLGVVGLPGTVIEGAEYLLDKGMQHTVGRMVNYIKNGTFADPGPLPERKWEAAPFNIPSPSKIISGSALVDAAAEVAPGIKYQPKTAPGEYARTIGEFAPGVLMPGTAAARVGYGVLAPALASETAGQITKGTAMEAPARVIAGIGAGLGGGMMASRSGTAGRAVSGAMGGVDDAAVTAAGKLMQEAGARGVALTWPEAIAQVTGGGATGLTGMQRVVEASRGGQPVMGPFMAQRAGQITRAAEQEFGHIAPHTAAPSMIGPAIGGAADDTVKEATGLINRATRPAYEAAESARVGAQVHNSLLSDPVYAQVLREVRNNPALNRSIASLPDDSVGVIDMVQRRMREQGQNAAIPGQANSGNTIAAAYQDARQAPIAAAEAATGSRAAIDGAPAQIGSYEAARLQQSQLREKYLAPLMAGPIGKLANRDITTQQAVTALFPTNPLAGSASEIVNTVGALTRKNPMAARQLVRTHIESTFNEAAQALQGGANQFGGAGFVAAIKGNKQQAENLAAAIHGVGGPDVLKGFDDFLNVLSATGQRQRIGSQTAFNQELQAGLKKGGAVSEIASNTLVLGTRAPARIRAAYEDWQLGKNTEQIAKLFTNPDAISTFRQLAKAAPGSPKAQAIAVRLGFLALQGTQAADNPVPSVR